MPYLEGTTSGVLKLAVAFGIPVIATPSGDLLEETPRGGGLLLDCEADLTEALRTAIMRVQADEARFIDGMREAGSRTEWRVIGRTYANFLFPALCDTV
ncbi:MAG: hypothetical protein NVSMB6_09720 [Burkholderiaceae bacterium]